MRQKYIYLIILVFFTAPTFSQLLNPTLIGDGDKGGLKQLYYPDKDGDGYGDKNVSLNQLEDFAAPGYVANASDCNDNDATIYPGAPELCDGKDNDCDGQVDENKPEVPSIVSVSNQCGKSILTRGIPPAGITWYWQSSSFGTSTSNSSTTVHRTSGSSYYLRARNSSGCWGLARSVSYSIKATPPAPAIPQVTKHCGYTVISKTLSLLNTDWVSYWQTSANGTSTVDSSEKVSRNTSGTVYLRIRDMKTGCWGPSISVSYNVDSEPAIPSAPTVVNYCGSSVLTRKVPPSGITYYWQSSSTGISTSSSASSITRTSGSTYYLRARNNTTGCWSKALTVYYSIKIVPNVPAEVSVFSQCGSSVLTRTNPPTGVTWYWQSSSTGISTTNSNSSITITSGTVYYLRAKHNTSGCWSTARKVNYSIIATPSIPNAPLVVTNCGSTVLTRSTSPDGVTWYWQSSSTGTSTSNSNVSIIRTSGTVYYLRSKHNITGCWSGARTINYTIKSVPTIPVLPSITTNCGNTILTRSTPPSGVTLYWQTSSTGTSTTNTDAFVTRTSGTVYYLRGRNTLGCWGPTRTINYTIKSQPPAPALPTAEKFCGSTLLTKSSDLLNLNWKSYWQTTSTGISTSNSADKLTKTSGTRMYVRIRDINSGCWGPAVSIDYTVQTSTTYYVDSDGDGFGDASNSLSGCVHPTGYVTNNSDCNDNNNLIHPNTIWYQDIDNDGWGNSSVSKKQCNQPLGYVLDKGDYDDSNNLITNIAPQNFYQDLDSDGYGNPNVKSFRSVQPNGYVTDNSDCDDTNAAIHPNTKWYLDSDGDGFGNVKQMVENCTKPRGYVATAGDDCPNEFGTVRGCSGANYSPVSLSDENYVFTRVFQKPITEISQISNEADVIESVTYYDGLGRTKQNVAIKSSLKGYRASVSNVLTEDWTLGKGGTAFYIANGDADENNRNLGVDPKGELSILWKCGNDNISNADGGWNTNYFNIDKNVGYRYTVWVKRTGSQDGTTYHGTQNVNNLNGTENNNPYFWLGDLPQIDTWYLLVGVIHPYDYEGGNSSVSGVYDTNGNKVINGTDFKWRSAAENSRFRSYLYYSTNVQTNQYFWNPVVQKLDGTENSLNSFFSNLSKAPKDIVTHFEYDNLGRQAKNILPFASENSNGAMSNVSITYDINKYYAEKYSNDFESTTELRDINPFSEQIFENSPLSRTMEQAAPGHSWRYDKDNYEYLGANYTPMPNSYYGFTHKYWDTSIFFDPEREQPEGAFDDETRFNVEFFINVGNILTFKVYGPPHGMDLLNNEPKPLLLGEIDYVNTFRPLKDIDLGNLVTSDGETTPYRIKLINNKFILSSDNGETPVISGLNTSITIDLNEPILESYDAKVSLNNTIKFEYKNNSNDEVIRFDVNGIGTGVTLVKNGFYVSNTLYKNIIKDENWKHENGKNHTTEEFKDLSGNVVLKRSYNNNIAHDTYYVYDKFNNLSYVIPPKVNTVDGVSLDELENLCYQYRYDERNRLSEKKIPGKGWEYIIYNKLNQPILTQDAIQRPNKEWLFTKYDAFGRVVYTGLVEFPWETTREGLQQNVNNLTGYVEFETKINSPITVAGTTLYYTSDTFPRASSLKEVYTVNYYDNYDVGNIISFNPANGSGTWEGMSAVANVKGLPTVSQVKVLETDKWVTTATYYDEKGRPWETHVKNDYLNTEDWVLNKLDFTGKTLKTQSLHTKNGVTITTVDTFLYDNQGRLIKQKQNINGQEETIAENSYDELGQLISKEVGGGLQTVDYSYNIRGWLTAINDVNDLGNDLFSFKIGYDKPRNGGAALFNGNISETEWRTANDNTLRSYKYSYDPLNRITRAISNDDRYNLYIGEYDKMGNILKLNRKGHNNADATSFGYMDILTYTYDGGNKLVKVDDTVENNYGFKDGNKVGDDFNYDENGNMIIDRNKGINNIQYNHLNLPKLVSISGFGNNGTIQYVYDAVGTKLKKIVKEGSNIIETEYAGGYVYENNELKFINFNEGYLESENNEGFIYTYQYKDHLGNIRLSYSDSNNDGIITNEEIKQEKNYYPFGMQHSGYNHQINNRPHNYGFNGVEEESDLNLNLLSMDLRKFDGALARWISIDPVTHHSLSTYNAFDNNPIYWTDPSGADSDCLTCDEQGRQTIKDGRYITRDQRTGGKYDKSVKNGDSRNNQQKSKKYHLLTQGTAQGYLDWKPDTDARGNELTTGEQYIIEKINVMNKYLVKYSGGRSEMLYELTEITLQTNISSDGSKTTTNLIISESSGNSLNNLSEPEIKVQNLGLDQVSTFHNKVVDRTLSKLHSTNSAWAASHHNKAMEITGYGASYSVYDILKSIVKRQRPDVFSSAWTMIHLSIRFTNPNSQRLNFYYRNFRKHGSIFKPISN